MGNGQRMRLKYRVGQKVNVAQFGETFVGEIVYNRLIDAGGTRSEKIWVQNEAGEEHAFMSFDGQDDGVSIL